ncbi:MAG: hypothetical protein M3R30_04895 [Candidatus Eremiobacteraeota bacterium]|nr:hypothetical protein [Candidatus Eremiobacteraeota bacterium]
MRNFIRGIVPGVALVFVPIVAGAVTGSAPTKPLRHLTYTFTYSQSNDRTQHDSGIGGPSSGMADSHSGKTDKGTITADVMQATTDLGLIVSISEQSQEGRTAESANCAVYGNTNVVCDANKKVNDEEYALLRLLGREFVNTALLDERNHWSIASSSPLYERTSDFTVLENKGDVLKITETRVEKQKGAQAYTASVDGKITYDLNKTVPVAIDENTMLRQNVGMGSYETDQTQIFLALQSDSLGGTSS